MGKLSDVPEFYVYVHRRATDGTVFYVGKGKGRRHTQVHGRSKRWKACALKHGFSSEVVYRELTEAEAFAAEVELILMYGRDTLCNMSNGGEGNAGKVISAAQREMIRAFHTGKKDKPETIARKRAASAWRQKQVRCCDTGEVFAGVNECARALGLANAKVSQVCNGKRPHTKGRRFEFVNA